jgi:hypothetical protein
MQARAVQQLEIRSARCGKQFDIGAQADTSSSLVAIAETGDGVIRPPGR